MSFSLPCSTSLGIREAQKKGKARMGEEEPFRKTEEAKGWSFSVAKCGVHTVHKAAGGSATPEGTMPRQP